MKNEHNEEKWLCDLKQGPPADVAAEFWILATVLWAGVHWSPLPITKAVLVDGQLQGAGQVLIAASSLTAPDHTQSQQSEPSDAWQRTRK